MTETIALPKKVWPQAAAATAIVGIVVGVSVAFGWAEGIDWLKRFVPGEPPMEASTALNLALTGMAALLLKARFKHWQITGQALGLVMTLGALTTLVESMSGRYFGTTLTIWSSDPSSAGLSYPGPMAPVAATVFACLGAALFMYDRRLARRFYCNEVFAAAALCVALMTLLGNACGANKLCTINGCIVTTFPTSMSFLIASAMVLLLRPERGAVSFITADSVAGIVLRRLLAGFAIIPAIFWLQALGQKCGYFDAALGLCAGVVMSLAVVVYLAFFGARVLSTIDRDREEHQRRAIDSSRRVAELSHQLATTQDHKQKRLKHVCLNCGDEFDLAVTLCIKCGGELSRLNKQHYIGEKFDSKFVLKDFLGEGGMSAVYKAENIAVGKLVALKVLNSRLTSDTQAVRRLQQEAKAAGALNHANLVQVFDFGISEEGEAYLVMELLKGKSLSALLDRDGLLAPDDVVALFTEICLGLEYAHERGIIHRDLKPSNIMLVQEGEEYRVKIVDFGIARDLRISDSQKLTTTGELIGSPPYMSPEQCRGQVPDARSDIYSLGCMMYECLSGSPPFVASHVMALINKHLHEEAHRFDAELNIPNELEHLVLNALTKDSDERIQSVREFRRLLSGAATPQL